ncbi:MAG: tetratricopeptide repeat protein [Terriglobales bacterium]|jgi:tetratricopeptide (TPR) repeat protein
MFSWIRISFVALLFCTLLVFPLPAQNNEQLEVGPPPLHRADPPPPELSPDELEQRGDELRMEKNFLDAVDYYQAALKGTPGNSSLFNKIGICQLMMQRYRQARKSFEHSIRVDSKHADAYNNLGVTYYTAHNYNGAIREYEKAISLDDGAASYYSNMGTAYFGKRQFEKAIQSYAKAVKLDPEIFDRTSHAGVQAKLPSPDDRAHYDYVLAKMYARAGVNDRSLHYLKKAMEEGYSGIKNVYKDNEFSALRKDPRFAELMSAKTLAIPN